MLTVDLGQNPILTTLLCLGNSLGFGKVLCFHKSYRINAA
jgi:hypothetical protein